jgi:hypothetical protein
MSIICVELHEENGAPIAEVCMDQAEMHHVAFQAIRDAAECNLAPGHKIARLIYIDDEGDSCSLSKETIPDAVTFAESFGEDYVRRLRVCVITMADPKEQVVDAVKPDGEPTGDEVAEDYRLAEWLQNYPRSGGPRQDQFKAYPWFDDQGWVNTRPLHRAAMRGETETIKSLCGNGKRDPNEKMSEWFDSEPLGWAASFGQLDAVIALIQCGADPFRPKNKAGYTPLTDAQRERHGHIVDFLREYQRRAAPSNAACPQQLEHDVLAEAFERLLQHPDLAVKAAARQAIEDATAAMQRRFAPPPRRKPVVHEGVTCDVTSICPIVGVRYKKRGENYDLCEAEFEKLSEGEQSNFIRIPHPRCQAAVAEELESRHGWDAARLAGVVNSPFVALLNSMLNQFPQEKLDEIAASLEPAFHVQRDCLLPCLNELQKQVGELRPAIEAAIEAGDIDQALIGISTCCRDVVGRAEELRDQALAAVEELMQTVEGFYECHLHDDEGKNDWHFVELRRSPMASGCKSMPTLTWSNRAGMTWTLTPSLDTDKDGLKLLVATDCPYFEDVHHVCELKHDDTGNLVGVFGPHQELYSRCNTHSAEALIEDASSICMVDVTSVSVETFSDAFSEVACLAGEAPAPMAAVVSSKMDVGGDYRIVEDAALCGDASAEFSELLQQYPNVTQAYRLGCVALSARGDGPCSVVSKMVVKNTSAVLSWSENASIRSVAGPSHGLSEMMLGAVPAGDQVEIVLDLMIKEGDGGRSAWAMCDERGEPFGPLLLFETVHM